MQRWHYFRRMLYASRECLSFEHQVPFLLRTWIWCNCWDRTGDIWISPLSKSLTTTKSSKTQRDNTKTHHQNFDCTKIADRPRMVNWSNYSQPPGIMKPIFQSLSQFSRLFLRISIGKFSIFLILKHLPMFSTVLLYNLSALNVMM